MTLYKWSQTAASDATADSTINWAEGQAPSSVNDSARAMMAAIAKYRDDNSGALVAGGTSTAYTLSTNQVFDSAAHMNGQSLCFLANPTNGAGATLNVDGLGAFPITYRGATPIPDGVLVSGSPYTVTFFSSVSQWRLQDFSPTPYDMPIGGLVPYIGNAAPNSNFAFPFGQAISRTTYATLYALTGNAFGAGDGSTTFNIPDLRGRVPAGVDNMGGSAAGRLTGYTINSTGGAASQAIAQANLPAATLTTTITDPGHQHSLGSGTGASAMYQQPGVTSGAPTVQLLSQSPGTAAVALTEVKATGITASTALGGSGTALPILQPTIALNYILRII